MATAKKRNPKLWAAVLAQVKSGSKGGDAGEWSARKAQLATKLYKEKGGGYVGPKSKDNSLSKWSREDWGTKSGKPSTQGSEATGERYLPRKAREALSSKEYSATSQAKREGEARGEQYVKQPKRIAKKTARYR